MKFNYLASALAAALLALGTPNTMAQETAEMKEFTLEDLNFGGTNYRNMIPGNRWLTWWGDQLVRLDVEECYLVDKKTGKETVLFTVDNVNEWTGGTPDNGLRSLSGVRFPYADQSVVLLNYGGERCLIDFEQKKQVIQQCADFINARYGEGTVTLTVKDQYYNMREQVEPHYHIVEKAVKAMEMAGVKARIQPIRGGTDGANLSFKGLPCPNIFAGGQNFHGKMEWVPVESMEKATQVILNIITLYAE